MSKYLIVHDYTSGSLGPFKAGDVVEIDDRLIEWLLRDSPGVAVPVKAGFVCPVCGKVAKSAAGLASHMRKHKGGKNRMVTEAKNRSEPEHVMTTQNMKGLTKDGDS